MGPFLIIIIIIALIILLVNHLSFEDVRKRRRDHYQEYLKSDAWQRKRFVVLRRDNWRCVRCGARATEVHHKKYAKYNIGREPIDWLVSVCKDCHESLHY